MNKNYNMNAFSKIFKTTIALLITLIVIPDSLAQDKLDWYLTAGTGATNIQNFTYKMKDFGYAYSSQQSPNVRFTYNAKPIFSASAGFGVSGAIPNSKTLRWDARINLRTSGYSIYVEHHKDLSAPFDPSDPGLPQLGETKTFRSWSLHLPLSMTFHPIPEIGFSLGTDLRYDLSANPATQGSDKPGFSRLQNHLGTIQSYAYTHPFILGAHVGMFVPISGRMEVGAEFYTDVLARLRFRSAMDTNSDSDKVFREMGVNASFRYKLKRED